MTKHQAGERRRRDAARLLPGPTLGTALALVALLGGAAGVAAQVEAPRAAPASARADTVPDPAEVPEPQAIPELLADEDTRSRGIAGIRVRVDDLAAEPRRATAWIQLLAVVEQVGTEAARLSAQAVVQAEEGDPVEASDRLAGSLDGLPEDDRTPVLALAAHLVEATDAGRAAALREDLLAAAPDAPEAMEARLRLARHLAGTDEDRTRAIHLLEEMVVAAPSHPLAPAARQLLQELQGPSGGRR